jgi:hypothetical protein
LLLVLSYTDDILDTVRTVLTATNDVVDTNETVRTIVSMVVVVIGRFGVDVDYDSVILRALRPEHPRAHAPFLQMLLKSTYKNSPKI